MEKGISYYGCKYVRHVVEDLKEIREVSCNSVLLAVSEFDCMFWYNSLMRIIKEAKDLGLKVYWDFWGWGKVFGGEPPSVFLQERCECRQVERLTGKPVPAACFNTKEFRSYFWKWVGKVSSETEVDGIFLNEPHYWSEGKGWTCACPICTEDFRSKYGTEMPRELTREVMEFREERMVDFISNTARLVKELDPKKEVIVCFLPKEDPLIGLTKWEAVAKIREVDCLATDPYWLLHGNSLTNVREVAKRLTDVARSYGKKSQLWLQAFKVPKGKEGELVEAAKIMVASGVDSIFAWCYKGGEGSAIASERPYEVWRVLREIFTSIN
ncbi:MAG: hypothetical protein B6U69_02150 [Thermofilum sp. ex4484_15]|nr:MAG: hypothetical protein B6U69_02150 [Thermofilum sp. ex4484_15]